MRESLLVVLFEEVIRSWHCLIEHGPTRRWSRHNMITGYDTLKWKECGNLSTSFQKVSTLLRLPRRQRPGVQSSALRLYSGRADKTDSLRSPHLLG